MLKSLFAAAIVPKALNVPQNGSVSPGAETAVSSPEKANLIGVTAEGPGAVSNFPAALQPSP
jgi:hypothetical protein